MALLLLIPGERDWKPVRPLLGIIAMFAGTMAIQLIPLPPAIWSSMPGHARFALSETSTMWRATSMTPDLTVNAIFALLPAAAVLIAYAGLASVHRQMLARFIIALAAVSAILGIVQVVLGLDSLARLYDAGEDGLPTGLLANRNHQAAMLAVALPLIGATIAPNSELKSIFSVCTVLGGITVLILLPVILLTGSRAGLVLLTIGLIAMVGFLPVFRGKTRVRSIAVILLAALLISLAFYTGRTSSVERLMDTEGPLNDLRLKALPAIMAIAKDFFPFGIGHGAFDSVYRTYEPDALLNPLYFNRAHNDFLELFLSGGVAILIPIGFFVFWLIRRAIAIFAASSERRSPLPNQRLAKAGVVTAGMLLLASVVDYPLRTALISIIFALACCWAATPAPAVASDHASPRLRPN